VRRHEPTQPLRLFGVNGNVYVLRARTSQQVVYSSVRSIVCDDGGLLRSDLVERLPPGMSLVAYAIPVDNDSQW
jgi:hypothetical protein